MVSVILDGENAWEYYPHNGHYFLDHLYALLEKHPRVQPVRYSDVLKLPRCRKLKQLCAGSWVYGSFSTWIGDPDKNRAWELLVQAKLDFDDVVKSGKLDDDTLKQATRQLAIAEGSDWFWWFGDYNPGNSVSDFDQLFRIQLRNLYDLMGLPAPDTLDTPVSVGGGDTAANAGTMVRNV